MEGKREREKGERDRGSRTASTMMHELELLPPQLLYAGTVEVVLIVLAAHTLKSRRRDSLFRAALLLLFASIALFFVLNCGYLAVPRPPPIIMMQSARQRDWRCLFCSFAQRCPWLHFGALQDALCVRFLSTLM